MSLQSNHDLLADAQQFLQMGQLDRAIDLLCQLLGRDPNHAVAHAMLALALVEQGRLHAARHEASLALSQAPNEPFCLYAAANVAMVRLEFRIAHEFLDNALALEPENPHFLAARGRLGILEQRWPEAQEAFEAALAIEPDLIDALVGLSTVFWRSGAAARAELVVREALRLEPANPEALVQMGWLHLGRGEAQEARDHALWVLQQDATDDGALTLLTAIKARESRLLGFWWRFNSWMMHKGGVAQITILVGLYLVVQFARTMLQQNGMEGYSGSLSLIWLGFCIYTWVGPAMFENQLKKELEKVRLQPNF